MAPPERARALIGETSEHVRAALGPPALRRDEGNSQVWLYAGPGGCRINLILIQDGDHARVATAAAHTEGQLSEAACLRSIATAGSSPNASAI